MTVDAYKFPQDVADFKDFATIVRRSILPPYIPPRPPLGRADRVFTQGSCFAGNIHEALLAAGIDSQYLPVLEKQNSPAANRLLFDYTFNGVPFANARHEGIFSSALPLYKPRIIEAAAIIFTVGVAFVPHLDGEFAPGFSREEQERVEWELSSVDENFEHLTSIIDTIRKVNQRASIILTVSPIPLRNAVSEESVFVADCMSKSILRTAVSEVMRLKLHKVHYWPSFEAIRWLGGHYGQIYGTEGEDQRHPGKSYIDTLVNEFIRAFFA